MMNNFDMFLSQQIKNEVQKQISEVKQKETIVKETIIKENLEDSLRCYTVKEVSKFIGIGEIDVRKLIASGELKAIKFRSTKIPACELERFLQNSTGKDFTDILGN